MLRKSIAVSLFLIQLAFAANVVAEEIQVATAVDGNEVIQESPDEGKVAIEVNDQMTDPAPGDTNNMAAIDDGGLDYWGGQRICRWTRWGKRCWYRF